MRRVYQEEGRAMSGTKTKKTTAAAPKAAAKATAKPASKKKPNSPPPHNVWTPSEFSGESIGLLYLFGKRKRRIFP